MNVPDQTKQTAQATTYQNRNNVGCESRLQFKLIKKLAIALNKKPNGNES